MENNVTSLLLKLILQKNNLKNLILVILAATIVVALVNVSSNSCGVKHIQIINDLNAYEDSLDPEFCEETLEKIYSFNEQCEPQMEILDCG